MIQKKPLRAWMFEGHLGTQAVLVAAVLAAVFLRVLPVEMQKRIINEAIGQSKVDALLLYSGLYLAAVVAASSLKYLINVLQGYIGQRVLQSIRSALYRHILRLPLSFYRSTSSGTVINALASELAVVGEYLGGALAVPLTSILTLAAFAGYMVWLDPLLAGLSLAVFPLEMAFIPFLQRRYNRLNRKRIDATRDLSTAVAEAVAGISEVHAYASYGRESARFDGLAHRVFRLRHRMNLWGYGVKFANNFIQKIGPFLLFLVGGWLAISGRFSLGALVAFLSAYDNLYDPWKELMEFYQLHQDSAVRYRRIMESFDAEPEFVLEDGDRPPAPLTGAIEARNLGLTVEGGTTLLDDINLSLAPGEHLALVGHSGSGKSTLAMVLGQLVRYDKGHVLVDGRELKALPKLEASASIGYVSQAPFLFSGTLKANLLYGLEASRNAGGQGPAASDERILAVLEQVGLSGDVLRFGLNARLDRGRHIFLAPRLVDLRERLRDSRRPELDEIVEYYVADRFLRHSDLYRNIVFGDPLDERFAPAAITGNPEFLVFLAEQRLLDPLVALGAELASRTVELLGGLGDDALFFQASPILPEEFEAYAELDATLRAGRPVRPEDRSMLLGLALRFVPARHRMVDLPARLEERILAARLEFMATIGGTHAPVCLSGGIPAQPAEQPEAQPRFAFYCRDVFVYSQSVLENLLFGQVKDDRPGELERAQELAVAALEEAGLLSEILAVGLDFDVGSLGGRLSGGQRQKTSLARALLKEPRILILDEATASLDNASQARIQRYLETELKGRCTVIAVIHRLDIVRGYDRIAVFRSGRVVESGTYDQLMAQGGLFRELALGAGGTEGTEWTGGAEVAGWPGEPEGERGIPAGLRPGAV